MKVLIKSLFYLYIFAAVILPPLPYKIYLFVLLSFLYLLAILKAGSISPDIADPLVILIIFLVYFLYGLLGNSKFQEGFQLCFSLSFLLLFPFARQYSIDIARPLFWASIIVSLLVIMFYGIYFLNENAFRLLLDYFIRNRLGRLGLRQFGRLSLPMVFFVSSPILLISFLIGIGELMDKFSVKGATFNVLIMIGIALSGSRGLILAAAFGVVVVTIIKRRTGVFTILLIMIISVMIIYGDKLQVALSSKDLSNAIKLGHWQSFLSYINIKTILVGDGLAAHYFSKGYNAYTYQTELTAVDLVRYFGIPNTFIVFLLLFFRRGRLYHRDKISLIIFIIYLADAMTNPLLLNSTGMIVVFWYWQRADPKCSDA